MITLYYHVGACSTANHFALEEAGVEYEAIPVNLRALDDPLAIKVRALNPMAQTPTIILDDGMVLTQNAATLPFIADLAPEKRLFPSAGTTEARPGGELALLRRVRSPSEDGGGLLGLCRRGRGGKGQAA